MVRPGPPPPSARRPEVGRIDRALAQVRSCRPRLPADLADQLEQAAVAAGRDADLLGAEIDELHGLVAGLDPARATTDLKDAQRQRAAVGPGDHPRYDALVASARQRYLAVHTAWNALDEAQQELAALAASAEEAAARATVLSVGREGAPSAGAELAHVTDRIEALRRARAELGRLDPTPRS